SFEDTLGITEGDEWKVRNKFLMGHLSKLGMGKSEFELKIHNLLDIIERYIEETKETAQDFRSIISNFTFNTITAIVTSKQYDINSDYFTSNQNLSAKLLSGLSGLNFMILGDLYPYWLKLKGADVNMVKRKFYEMADLAQMIINERLETFDANNCHDLLDFLD
ncbi:cytochrome P450 2U1-like protein, partial [Leptotrombidium deliense]